MSALRRRTLLLSVLSLPLPLERIEAADGSLGLHEADWMPPLLSVLQPSSLSSASRRRAVC